MRAPSPPPPPRRTKETRETDIDIHTSRNNTEIDISRSHEKSRSRTPQPTSKPRRNDFFDDSDLYDRERDTLRVHDTRLDIDRRRSVSARPDTRERDVVKVDIRESSGHRHDNLHDDDDEAEFYRRKVAERAFIGEAYNGATKDWAIVDVPPGTERVRMDGVGGASQDITWQRYNGVRRSKFIPERERDSRVEIWDREEPRREKIDVREESNRETSNLEIEISTSNKHRHDHGPVYEREREFERIEETSDRHVGMPRPPTKSRNADLWTEITKDLVVREAIEQMGYDFEETEYFYYIIQYLRYVYPPQSPLLTVQNTN